MISNEQPPYSFEEIEKEYLARQFRHARNEDQDMEARIRRLERNIVELNYAGYGGGRQDADIPNFDIPVGSYITLPYDTIPVVGRGVTFDANNDDFVVTRAGVWQITLAIDLVGHDSSVQGRRFTVRSWNITDAQEISSFTVGIGRNQEDSLVMVVLYAVVTQAEVDAGDHIRIEVGNADVAITGGTLHEAAVSAVYVSELGEQE